MTGWFQLTVSCPNCLGMGTHHIGQQCSRPDSDDHEEIRSTMTGEIVRRDPVTQGGVFRARTCVLCGHQWQQREEPR